MAEDRATAVTSNFRLRAIKWLDVPKWLQWLWAGKDKNLLDPRMFDYPRLKVVVCEREDATATLFAPVHDVLMLDSLAFNPESDAKERLLSAKCLIQNVLEAAKADGAGEMIYVSSDERSDEFMAKHFGFKRTTVLRKIL